MIRTTVARRRPVMMVHRMGDTAPFTSTQEAIRKAIGYDVTWGSAPEDKIAASLAASGIDPSIASYDQIRAAAAGSPIPGAVLPTIVPVVTTPVAVSTVAPAPPPYVTPAGTTAVVPVTTAAAATDTTTTTFGGYPWYYWAAGAVGLFVLFGGSETHHR